jgi:ABC-type multidrug transport system permease subunit
MERSAEDEAWRSRRRSLIAFLGGICLLALALLLSYVGIGPDLLTTIAAIVGVSAMFYGLVAGVLVLLDRDSD